MYLNMKYIFLITILTKCHQKKTVNRSFLEPNFAVIHKHTCECSGFYICEYHLHITYIFNLNCHNFANTVLNNVMLTSTRIDLNYKITITF